MKALEERGFVVLTEAPGRAAFLCDGRHGLSVTTDLKCARRFERHDDADEARSRFEETHQRAAHTPGGWRVTEAVTRTTFRLG